MLPFLRAVHEVHLRQSTSTSLCAVLLVLLAVHQVHLGRAHAAPQEDGIRGGLASAARLFHSLWPDSINAWAIRCMSRGKKLSEGVISCEKEDEFQSGPSHATFFPVPHTVKKFTVWDSV